MTDSEIYEQIVNETCELVKQAANKKRRTITVSPEVAGMLDQVAAQEAQPVAASASASAPPSPATATGDPGGLDALQAQVAACTQCGLHETRTNTVFGDGSPTADLVFVGEAPGADEDAQGIPFVGRAGKLLTDIIEKGMKIPRSDVYICNVLKCRPPENRDPKPAEKNVCEPFLIQQLELIRPKVICALGTHAAQTLLNVDTTIGKLRGSWHFYHGIPLRATYHPAYLLRSPREKSKTWEDVQAIMRVLAGEETPEPPDM